MKATLLTKEQIVGHDALETMQDRDLICASGSDFAISKGSCRSADYHYIAADGKRAVWDLWLEGQMILNKHDSVESTIKGETSAVRPALSADETACINPADIKPAGKIKGFETVFYGEFPQSEEKDEETIKKLNEFFDAFFFEETPLKETGKIYSDILMRNNFSSEEYIFNGSKYIVRRGRVWGEENRWFKVEPVEWVKDPSGVWFTKQALFADISNDKLPEVLYEFSKAAFSECSQRKAIEEDLYTNDWQFRPLEEKRQILESLQKDKEIKAQIAKNKERLKNGPKLKGKSGVVIADEIAKRQISGEEKRVITPQVGKELRQEIMKEMNNKKGQRE